MISKSGTLLNNKMGDTMSGNLNLSQLRNLVRQFIDNHLYDSAVFWADKVCSLSKNNPQDVVWLAHSLYLTKQPLRAAEILKSSRLTNTDCGARYLAAKCYVDCKEWRSALEVLEGEDQILKSGGNISYYQQNITTSFSSSSISSSTTATQNKQTYSPLPGAGGSNRKTEAATSLLKGIIYESLDNREIATQCYKDALQHDVYCYEAFERLVSHHCLTSSEEIDLVESLPYSNQCNEEETQFIKSVYSYKVNKYGTPPIDEELPSSLKDLSNNLDYLVSLAERHFNNSNHNEAYEYAKYVLKIDNLHEGCLPLYISCLSSMNKKNELYNLANRLVNTYPSKSISWYAIGSYYLLINKNEPARKYFSKATTIDAGFGPAWLGFAHSFASEGEQDQAISAYFSASQYMPGSHLPYLYLGLEYALSRDKKLATKFYKEALKIAPNDPHIKLELGAMYYENGETEKAEIYMLECLSDIQNKEDNIMLDIWEPLYNNLGHVSRKLKKYETAISYHEHAYLINPKNAGTCSAIGLCYMLLDQSEKAVPMLHKALSIKRNDTIAIKLLSEALENVSKSTEESMENASSLKAMSDTSIVSDPLPLDLHCMSKSTTDSDKSGDKSTMNLDNSSRMSMEMSGMSTP